MPASPSIPNTAIHALYVRIAPRDIALVKFLFESYEEVGLVRTIDRHAAVIVLLVVPDFLVTAREILRAVQMDISCAEIAPPMPPGEDWLMREVDG